jgi:hypothetical protein
MRALFIRSSRTMKFYEPYYAKCMDCGAPILTDAERHRGSCESCRLQHVPAPVRTVRPVGIFQGRLHGSKVA